MIKCTTVENGRVRGIQGADPRVVAYKGIPFAAPPVGELRWRPPQPAANWEGELYAADFAPIPMQAIPGVDQTELYSKEFNPDPDIPMSEDCLYLNVWTPAKTPADRLPVFVWYFGGGLQVGNTAEMEFNGERLARRGIVVVSVAYRLNVFGFLAHPEITAENPDFPANFGNLDQKFGTEWVKRNIAAFGGDPHQITIGGQSAGGGSVLTQLASPLNHGLFQRAIVQSGTMFGSYSHMVVNGPRVLTPTLEAVEKVGEEFFETLGVKTLAEARAISAETLRDKAVAFNAMWPTVPDGNFVPHGETHPIPVMRNQRPMSIPLLMSNTTTEFPARTDCTTQAEFEAQARTIFGDRADEFLSLVKADTYEQTLKNAAFSTPELGIRIICEQSGRVPGTPDNYYCTFGTEMPGGDNPGPFHSSDLWFFFDSLGACWRPFVGKHYDLARLMANYWANFVKTGDPNGPDADGSQMPYWEPYRVSKSPMTFLEEAKMGTPAEESALMRFLVDFYVDQFSKEDL